MTPISSTAPISHVAPAGDSATTALSKSATSKPANFGSLINHLVDSTNQDQVASDQAVAEMVAGKTDNIQQVVLAVAKAELSFKFFMEIRNQLIDSYNELMRMQF